MGKRKSKSLGVCKASAGGKKKVWGAKNVLHSPFSLALPPALAGSADVVIGVLREVFPEPPMFRHSAPKPRVKDRDDADDLSISSNGSDPKGMRVDTQNVENSVADGVVDRQCGQPSVDEREIPKNKASSKRPAGILVGMNEVTRGLERGNVALVVVARDSSPPILISHLPALCYMQNAALVPACGNGDDIAAALGVKKLLAFGFLRPEMVQEAATRLRSKALLDKLTPHATLLDFPWLAVAKGDRNDPPVLPEPHLAPPSKLL